MPDLPEVFRDLPVIAQNLGVIVAAVAIALVAHAVTIAAGRRVTARTPSSLDDTILDLSRRPLRWIMVAVALTLARPSLALPEWADIVWKQAAGFVVPALIGWLAVVLVRVWVRAIELRYDIGVSDNLNARRRRTRSAILSRIAVAAIVVVTIALMLLSVPSIRSIGITLMASAGLAGLAVGAAAQPALKNVIAGVQMAFTEPIRLDDVVIIEGQWGRIEEIRLTYVVVAIWDERRLVVPVARFLDQPFENWTRTSSRLLGSAFLYLDATADIARLRAKFTEIVAAHPLFDGRASGLQVTDVREAAIEVRMIATASDASRTFDLRCAIREAMLAFVRDEMPGALPRTRLARA